MSVRIIVVSHRGLLRALFSTWIRAQAGMECVAEVAEYSPDSPLPRDANIVIWDVRDCRDFASIERLRKGRPDIRVLIVTASRGDYVLQRGLGLASGFVHEADGADILVAALAAVASGGIYQSAAVVQRQGAMALRMLTDREMVIFEHAATGTPDDEIARLVGIRSATVETHRRNLARKLGVADRLELVVLGIRLGVVSPEHVSLGQRKKRGSTRRRG